MKKSCLIIPIAVFILIFFNGIQAQRVTPKLKYFPPDIIGDTGIRAQNLTSNLDQVELIKQFVGSWKVEIGKDTTCIWETRSFGTGLEGNIKYVTKGETIKEGKQLLGYDKRTDKFIDAELMKGKDIKIFAVWFTTKNKCLILLYNDITNPEKASFKEELEFKTPDLFLETIIVNNKPDKTYTFTRVK